MEEHRALLDRITGDTARENVKTLTTDRDGFDYTVKNCKRLAKSGKLKDAEFNLSIYNDFDMCISFPTVLKDPNKMLKPEKLNSEVLRIFMHRSGPDAESLDHPSALHGLYGIQDYFTEPMSNQKFHDLLRKVLFSVLKHLGVVYTVSESSDSTTKFVRMRLKERSALRIADEEGYLLQVDSAILAPYMSSQVVDSTEDEIVPPYLPYDSNIEGCDATGNKIGLMKDSNRVFARYDRLSRPVRDIKYKDSQECKELSLFKDIDRIRLLKLGMRRFINIDYLVAEKYFHRFYPLHQAMTRQELVETWANFGNILSTSQPLDDIREYFGEEVAMYFAWAGFYAKSLLYPSVIGIVMACLSLFVYTDDLTEKFWWNHLRTCYCMFLIGWSTWFVHRWIRQEKRLALRWGVDPNDGYRIPPEEHFKFKHDGYLTHPIEPAKFTRTYSKFKKIIREILAGGFLLAVTFMCVIFVNEDLMALSTRLSGIDPTGNIAEGLVHALSPHTATSKHHETQLLKGDHHSVAEENGLNPDSFSTERVALIISLLIKGLDLLWTLVLAKKVTGLENHQYVHEFEESLAFKSFFFKFTDYFCVLVYLAFFKAALNPCDSSPDGRCTHELRRQLVSILVIDVVMNIKEVVLPALQYLFSMAMAKRKLQKEGKDPNIHAYERENHLAEYFSKSGIEADWLELLVQYGMVSMFSMLVPVLPVVALISNHVEIRSDAFKLCHVYRRPFPRSHTGSRIWNDLQRTILVLSLIVNVCLCSFVAVGYNQSVGFRLVWSILLMIGGIVVEEAVARRFPPESKKYLTMKAQHQYMRSLALYGDNGNERNDCLRKISRGRGGATRASSRMN